MGVNWEKMYAYLDSEEFEKDMDKHIKELVAEKEVKQKEYEDFFESEAFKKVFNNIVESGEEHISDDQWMYGGKYGFITHEEYRLFFDTIWHFEKPKEVEDADFPTMSSQYKGLILESVSGQGTVTYIQVTPEAKALKVKDKLEKF